MLNVLKNDDQNFRITIDREIILNNIKKLFMNMKIILINTFIMKSEMAVSSLLYFTNSLPEGI